MQPYKQRGPLGVRDLSTLGFGIHGVLRPAPQDDCTLPVSLAVSMESTTLIQPALREALGVGAAHSLGSREGRRRRVSWAAVALRSQQDPRPPRGEDSVQTEPTSPRGNPGPADPEESAITRRFRQTSNDERHYRCNGVMVGPWGFSSHCFLLNLP